MKTTDRRRFRKYEGKYDLSSLRHLRKLQLREGEGRDEIFVPSSKKQKLCA